MRDDEKKKDTVMEGLKRTKYNRKCTLLIPKKSLQWLLLTNQQAKVLNFQVASIKQRKLQIFTFEKLELLISALK